MGLKNYFLGTDVHELYKEARSDSDKKFNWYFLEFIDLSASKGIPNLLSFGSIAWGWYSGEPLIPFVGVSSGEITRYFYGKSYENLRKAAGLERRKNSLDYWLKKEV
ncbi:hypothetical protein HY837_02650 [archaeon]|nr:hypothetical protein [archaeon]